MLRRGRQGKRSSSPAMASSQHKAAPTGTLHGLKPVPAWPGSAAGSGNRGWSAHRCGYHPWQFCRQCSIAQACHAPVGAALCCEEAGKAKDHLRQLWPLRSTGLLLQVLCMAGNHCLLGPVQRLDQVIEDGLLTGADITHGNFAGNGSFAQACHALVGAALCCEEAGKAKDHLRQLWPLRSTGLLLQVLCMA